MNEHPAPGLTADWLNAWLAAIGVTVLLPRTHLRWTEDPLPKAIFTSPHDQGPLPDQIAAALPTTHQIATWVISNITGKVNSPAAYAQLAAQARAHHDDTLALTVTDLGKPNDDGSYPKAPFDPPVPGRGDTPGTGKTLAWRLRKARNSFTPTPARVAATLNGTAPRTTGNGLGFDYRRLADGRTDPLIELLAFEALRMFPTRGNGTQARQRGWTTKATTPHAFRWATWTEDLDRWAIDAILDQIHTPTAKPRPPITAIFATVPYTPTGDSDFTRGYASQRLTGPRTGGDP